MSWFFSKSSNVLVSEDFEGTGTPSGWTVAAGTVDFDYTTTVIAGAQSYSTSTSTTGDAYVDFTGKADLWVRVKVRVTGTDDSIVLLSLRDASNNELARVEQPVSFHRFRCYHGASNTNSSDNELPQNATRWLWIHYTKGTGSNSSCVFYWSTTSTKGAAKITISGENETTDCSRVRFDAKGGATIKILDDLLVQVTEPDS